MEQTIITNSFTSPVSRSAGVNYSDDLVEVYQLVEHVEKGASGEDSDFVIHKRPVKVDSYHHNKVISERAKGASLKEIIARCEKTGDMSTLTQRKVIFGDGFKTPSKLGDALELAHKGEKFLDSLKPEERERYMKLAKMDEKQFEQYINDIVEKRTKVKQEGSAPVVEEKKGEEK